MDNPKEARTLIVSFVIALGVLIPLRFVEISNLSSFEDNTNVLGVSDEIVLPKESSGVLVGGASVDCISREDADLLSNEILTELALKKANNKDKDLMMENLSEIEKNTCK